MKISVVIPCHNEEEYLPRLLDSLSCQTLLPDEVLLVDNNSTDRSVEIARRFGISIIREKRQGIIPARNSGFDQSRGDIILRTDADSILPNNWVANISRHFSNPFVVGAGGPVVYNQIRLPNFVINSVFNSYYTATEVVYGRPILYGPNTAVRRDTWQKVRSLLEENDRKVHEDMEFSYKLSSFGEVVFDYSLVVGTSHRRAVRKPLSMFVEYPYRGLKTWLRVKNIIK
jgi:glycosyltransferase involved in cell wall biosynthesis